MSNNKDLRLAILILIVIAFLFIFKFVGTYILNEIVIDYYHERVYRDDLVKGLYIANLTEREVAYYNHGNILFKEGKYEEAKARYEKALTYVDANNVHTCPIVNNYTLTLVQLIDAETDEEKISELEKATEGLYQYGCAGEGEQNGSSESSDNLEEQIEQAIQEIKDGDTPVQTEEEKEQEKELEDKLEDQEKEGRKERQKDIDDSGNNNSSNSKSW